MPKKNQGKANWKVVTIVNVDDRGQMVLPKEFRKNAKIKKGDRFALLSYEGKGRVYCISLVKVDDLGDAVREMLGPVMRGVVAK